MRAPLFADSQDLLRQRRLERGLPAEPAPVPSARRLLLLGLSRDKFIHLLFQLIPYLLLPQRETIPQRPTITKYPACPTQPFRGFPQQQCIATAIRNRLQRLRTVGVQQSVCIHVNRLFSAMMTPRVAGNTLRLIPEW